MGKNPEYDKANVSPDAKYRPLLAGAPSERAVVSQSEARLQHECFLWMWNERPVLRYKAFHIPNGEWEPIVMASKRRGMGMVKGVWDFQIAHGGKLYFLEFKRTGQHRRITYEQYRYCTFMREEGYDQFWICTSLRGFKHFIDKFVLGLKPKQTPWVEIVGSIRDMEDEILRYEYHNEEFSNRLAAERAKIKRVYAGTPGMGQDDGADSQGR